MTSAKKKQASGSVHLTEQQRDEIQRRAAAGESHRAIARAVGCSARTVGRHLLAADEDGRGTMRRRRRSGKLSGEGGVGGSAPAVETVEDGDPRARLVALVGKTRLLRDQAELDGNSLAFVRLSTHEADLGKRLRELDAQQPPDPRLDPANREARDLVLRLLRLTLEGGAAEPPERDAVEA